jgi:iron-sulfur cluster assembly protein
MIQVTDRAVQAIRDCIAAENKTIDQSFLRVAVKGGGCSGLMYQLSIDVNTVDTDVVIASGDVRIVVDRKSKLFLHGLTLDYTSGLNGKGFVFSNPNAKATCGCGESFTV